MTVVFLHIFLLVGGVKLAQDSEMPKASAAPSPFKLQLTKSVLLIPKVPGQTKSANIPVPSRKFRPHPMSTARSLQKEKAAVDTTGTAEAGPAVGAGNSDYGSAPGVATANARALFKAELRSAIERNKSYPSMSRRLGQTGTVVVAFTLEEDGKITDVRVETPSRFERLNESALEAVKKVEKFRPIPSEWGEEKISLSVPVKFLTI
jgi:TonB family protein